jgi:hypothetical protein
MLPFYIVIGIMVLALNSYRWYNRLYCLGSYETEIVKVDKRNK